MKRFLKWLVILGLLGAAGWWGYRKWRPAPEKPKYDTVRVARGNIEVTIQSSGVVHPQNRLEIKPTVAGRIEQILVNEGDLVKAGQILVWMSSSERAALLDAARARGTNTLAYWQDIYKATPLVAPLDGMIIARLMEPGQSAVLNDKILVMSDMLVVEAQVDETDLARIRLGQQVEVRLDAYPNKPLPPQVSHIAYEAVTTQNVTIYEVQVLPKKMPHFARSGMSATLSFLQAQTNGALVIPAEAVVSGEDKPQVRIPPPASGGEPVLRGIETGLSDGRLVAVISGLEEGDTVLVPKVQLPVSNGEMKKNPFMPTPPRMSRDGGSRRAGRP